ncbi:MAG TPA: 1-acyl-sn-glycerol-3-phosphate acyltransferase, partial [Anaerolineales bacterium]
MLIEDPQVRALTKINIEDLLTSLGLEKLRQGRSLLEVLCRYPARRFAQQVIGYDSQVGEMGLQAAGRQMLDQMVGRLEISGQENIPSAGPVLLVSNHPGMTDTMALFASIPRTDLRVVAAERPFLQALPHTSRHLIYVRDEASQRMGVVRATTQHLRLGGAVLTFPAGQIEPDPACMPGASDSLQQYSSSMATQATDESSDACRMMRGCCRQDLEICC